MRALRAVKLPGRDVPVHIQGLRRVVRADSDATAISAKYGQSICPRAPDEYVGQVGAAGPEFKVLTTNALKDSNHASPAIAAKVSAYQTLFNERTSVRKSVL